MNTAALVLRGDFSLLAREYCWARFPGTPHLVLNLFTPGANSQPGRRWGSGGSGSSGGSGGSGGAASPSWSVWLVACETLQPPAPGVATVQQGSKEGSTREGSGSGDDGSSSSSGAAGEDQHRYMVYVMKKVGDTFSWQLAGPDASKRQRQAPQQAAPLKVRLPSPGVLHLPAGRACGSTCVCHSRYISEPQGLPFPLPLLRSLITCGRPEVRPSPPCLTCCLPSPPSCPPRRLPWSGRKI